MGVNRFRTPCHFPDPGLYRADVAMRALAGDGDGRTFTATEEQAANDAESSPTELKPLVLTVPMSELREVGSYEVALNRHDGVPEKRVIARNAPAAESRLVSFNEASFARVYPQELHDRVTFVAVGGGLGSGTGEGEIWQLLAGLLVVGLLVESLLAWRFGRR